MVKRNKPYLSILVRRYEYIDPVHLTVCKCDCLEVLLLTFARVENDPFLPIDHILGLLA